MDPRFLVHLAVIVDTGSLSRAAERLNVTQPTLTRTVKIIEDRTGIPVLKRERYGVSATALGHKLAQIGREIRRQTDLSRDIVGSWHSGIDGELNVALGPVIMQLIGSQLVKTAIEQKWDYKLFINTGLLPPFFKMLMEGSMDIVIGPDQLIPMGNKFTHIPLLTDNLALIIGAKSPLARKAHISKEELSALTLIGAGSKAGLLTSDSLLLEQANIPVANRVTINSDTGRLIELLETTDYAVVMPRHMFEAMMPQNHGCRIIELETTVERSVSIWVRTGEEARPEIEHFCRNLQWIIAQVMPQENLLFEIESVEA